MTKTKHKKQQSVKTPEGFSFMLVFFYCPDLLKKKKLEKSETRQQI